MRDEKFKIVSAFDPGLASDRMTAKTMREYMEKRDFALIQQYLVAGKASIFHCREVPQSIWSSFIESSTNDSERFSRAFMAGVVKVDNLLQPDGVSISWEPTGHIGDVTVMTDAEAYGRFSPMHREEIGAVIYMKSFLPRWIEPTFQLRLSLLELLAGRPYLSAVPSQTAAAPSSSEQSLPTASQAETANA